jgi:hypothetical protein
VAIRLRLLTATVTFFYSTTSFGGGVGGSPSGAGTGGHVLMVPSMLRIAVPLRESCWVWSTSVVCLRPGGMPLRPLPPKAGREAEPGGEGRSGQEP